jgi:anaerobic selenocysteine-containing dehydrogenase
VPWDEALNLVASELHRVKKTYGNAAVYTSSGWASAGVFHNAPTQLFRMRRATDAGDSLCYRVGIVKRRL